MVGCNQGNTEDAPTDTEESTGVTDDTEAADDTGAGNDTETAEQVEIAEQFIQNLADGNYEQATQQFDETMAKELTPEKLEELWTTIQQQAGNFVGQENLSVQEQQGFQVVQLSGIFEKQDVVFTVSVDAENRVAGFFVK